MSVPDLAAFTEMKRIFKLAVGVGRQCSLPSLLWLGAKAASCICH